MYAIRSYYESLDTDSLFEEESDDFSEIDDAPEIADEISQLKGNT